MTYHDHEAIVGALCAIIAYLAAGLGLPLLATLATATALVSVGILLAE